jgi:hypothetical protein
MASTTLCASHQASLKRLASHLIGYSRKREYAPQTIVGQRDDRKSIKCSRLNMHGFAGGIYARYRMNASATIRRYCNRTQVVLVLPHSSSKFKTAGVPLKLNT